MNTFVYLPYSEVCKITSHPQNRNIDRGHLQKIKNQMKESFNLMPAITVNKRTGHSIDGQHRKKGYEELIKEGVLSPDTLLPVMYVDIPEDQELERIIAAQVNSKKWSPSDYIHSYIKDGNDNYIKLDDWAKAHTLTANPKDPSKPKYRYAGIMMKGSTLRSDLPCGTFVVSDEELKKADEVHAEVVKLIELFGLPFTGQWLEGLLLSWYKNRGLNTFKDYTDYIKKHPGLRKLPKATLSDWDAIFAKVHSELDLKGRAA